jgi:hypothetical protein
LVLLLLSGCFAVSKEQYEAIKGLESNYSALEARDQELSHALKAMTKEQRPDSGQAQEQ